MAEGIRISAADGQELHGTVYAPARARSWLLINSAMGVRRRFYRHLAGALVERGIGVVTYDYRGIGDSVLPAATAQGTRLEHWGREDFPAALRWLRETQSPARVVVLGHSVGGQLLGLAPEVRGVDGLVGVGTQSGHWRHWDGLERAKVATLWYAAIPLLTAFSGSFPAALFGLGPAIPAGVARQWAQWGRDPDYLRSVRVGPKDQYFDEVRCRLRTYLVEQDSLATERAVRAWHDWFPNADRELVNLGARNAAGRTIGHFGFFDPEIGAAEWPGLADFAGG
ncbi:MAG: alpha/beta fold hydrolase [Gammaproteobacteria bacterium]